MTGGMSPEQTAQILKALKTQRAKQEQEKELRARQHEQPAAEADEQIEDHDEL